MRTSYTKRQMLMLGLMICFGIFGVWLIAIVVGLQPEIRVYTQQPFSDAFSGINALFAGCAFGGVILTIWLQIHELQETRDELQKTASANLMMADASRVMAMHADQKAILDVFQTYCSEYFQGVKNDAMSVLIPCVASSRYCEFVVSRFFVADQQAFPAECWERVSKASYCKTLDEFLAKEQAYRYKLDELINFFTMLSSQENSKSIIANCDFSYSWWRPLLWMIAVQQEERYANNEAVRKYGTVPYLLNVVKRLDDAYGLVPFKTTEAFWRFFVGHPKVRQYGMDEAYHARTG